MNKIVLNSFLLIALFFSTSIAQDTIDGKWDGSLSIMETDLNIIVNFKTVNDSLSGTIDIPQQKANDLPLSNIAYNFPKISFVLEIPSSNVKFDGEIIRDSISGSFLQSGVNGSFYLTRFFDNELEITKPEVLDYLEEEVTFNNGDITLSGTLTLPLYPGKHPAVVMITGSGPQNRDEEIYGFKIFKIIAEQFTNNGIAVLRYDDRGVGGSTGNISKSTTEDFAGDVIEAVKFLQSRDDIRHDQVGLCGHSEGGIIAPLVASKDKDIAFIILVAGTGVTGEEIIIKQTRLILEAEGETNEDIKKSLEEQKELFGYISSGKKEEEIIAEIKKQTLENFDELPDEIKESIVDKEEYAETSAKVKYEQLSSPWMTYFLSYDPVPALEKVTCPVLLIFGELDLQVPVTQNEQSMVDALIKGGNKDYGVKIFPNANHLFQTAITGSPSKYAELPKEFVPGFLDFMTKWMLDRVSVSR